MIWNEEEKTLEIGSNQSVIIDKLFGPTVFAELRITPNVERGEWVIERQRVGADFKIEWVEWATVPAQLPDDDPEDES